MCENGRGRVSLEAPTLSRGQVASGNKTVLVLVLVLGSMLRAHAQGPSKAGPSKPAPGKRMGTSVQKLWLIHGYRNLCNRGLFKVVLEGLPALLAFGIRTIMYRYKHSLDLFTCTPPTRSGPQRQASSLGPACPIRFGSLCQKRRGTARLRVQGSVFGFGFEFGVWGLWRGVCGLCLVVWNSYAVALPLHGWSGFGVQGLSLRSGSIGLPGVLGFQWT